MRKNLLSEIKQAIKHNACRVVWKSKGSYHSIKRGSENVMLKRKDGKQMIFNIFEEKDENGNVVLIEITPIVNGFENIFNISNEEISQNKKLPHTNKYCTTDVHNGYIVIKTIDDKLVSVSNKGEFFY